MKTFGQLKAALRPILWPEGEASNLVVAHNKFFLDALIDLQTYVDCLQQDNTSIFPQCSTYYNCGLTVIDAPRGAVKKVSVAAEEDAVLSWCTKVDYMQVNPVMIREYLDRSLRCGYCLPIFFSLIPNACIKGYYPVPSDEGVPAGLPLLPLGYHYPQASTDDPYSRSGHGFWGLERGKIFIAPYIQSTEHVIIEWDGIKRTWEDADVVDEDPLVESAVMEYVRWQHCDKFEKDESEVARAMGAYNNFRALLIHQCREETRVRFREASHARSATGIGGNSIGTVYYNDQVTYTARCGDGEAGSPVTVTIPAGSIASLVSVADANAKASSEAKTQAESRLDCEPEAVTYTNNLPATATAVCQGGEGAPTPTGDVTTATVTVPAGTVSSPVSVADANQQAQALAQREAALQLRCRYWNAAQTAKVSCPSNPAQEFEVTIAKGAYYSDISQDDANRKAYEQAIIDATAARDDSGLCVADPPSVWNTVQVFVVSMTCPVNHLPVHIEVTVPANTVPGSTLLEANQFARYIGAIYGNSVASYKCSRGQTGFFRFTYEDPIS